MEETSITNCIDDLCIAVVGAGYVGLTVAGFFSELGNSVTCVDNNYQKIENLKKNKIPIYEPGIEYLIIKNKKRGTLSFSHSIKEATKKSDVIFICAGTPSHSDGSPDLSAIESVVEQIAKAMDNSYRLIVEKSTVPAHTGKKIKQTICRNNPAAVFDIASNPEFLREGSAVYDIFHPDRIVIGVESKKAEQILTRLYEHIKAPIIVCDIETAEIIKHASNSFLATKISFINAVSNICERLGADIRKVSEGMGLDKRIGKDFLNAGIGFGGACFPKDLDAFIHLAHTVGYDFGLLREVKKINEEQRKYMLKKIEDTLWIIKDKTIGVFGLSFKPDTDDIRNSVSIEVIKLLQKQGAKIKCYDPRAMDVAKIVLDKSVQFCKNIYQTAKDSDCLVIMTDWEEFKNMNLKKIKKALKQPVIIDGKNIFEHQSMKNLGFIYKCIGKD